MTTATMNNNIHEGRNIKRFREMLNITQDALAADLGDDWTQKKISLLEGKEKVEPEIIDQVAKVLKVPAEAIKNFSEEAANNYFNSFNDTSINNGTVGCTNYYCTFNPLDKYVEVMDENKRLYERLLQVEREKTELLQKLLEDKAAKK